MPWVAEISKPVSRYCVIERDDQVGYYLYIYEDDKSYDYLQDTLVIAMRQALEEFGVPLNAWQEVEAPAMQ